MALAHKTRFFTCEMTGAPAMTPAAGGIISVLDACLVNGFNEKTLTSLTVSGGIATATVSGGHTYTTAHMVIAIAGATPSSLNGAHRIISTPTSTTFTFDATGIADVTATGTITSKVAPAGWTKAFTGTNKAAYRNSPDTGSGFYFRIDDSGAYSAGSPVRGYDAMTDVDSGTRAFPTIAQKANFATRRSENATGDRTWALVADDRFFYLFHRPLATTERYVCTYFGDICSFDPADENACVIGACALATPTHGSFWSIYSSSNVSGEKYISSAHGEYANGSASIGVYTGFSVNDYNLYLNPTSYPANANINGGLILLRAGVVGEKTVSANTFRGIMPAFHVCMAKPSGFITSGSHAISLINGKPFLLVNTNGYGAYDSLVGIDLGDWR